MTKIKKRATALLMGTVTFFMALAMPYNTTRVYAADVAFSWVVNESSNTILNWILLYLGISVAPEAISEGKVFDKTGQFAMDFCQEFFGDTFEQWYVSNGFSEDIDTFKREFNNLLTQDFDAGKYVAGDIKSGVLDTIYKYLIDCGTYSHSNLNFKYSDLLLSKDNNKSLDVDFSLVGHGIDASLKSRNYDLSQVYKNVKCLYGHCIPCVTVSYEQYGVNRMIFYLVSDSEFAYTFDGRDETGRSSRCTYSPIYPEYYVSQVYSYLFYGTVQTLNINANIPFILRNYDDFCSQFSQRTDDMAYYIYSNLLDGYGITDVTADIPDVAGKDYAYDLVGWPDAWDIDKPDVKPWDDVDSLPIPGDIAIPKEIPGVTDLPGIMDGVIGGTIPWPDIIDIIKDLPVDPTPDPEPEPEPEPDPDPELPEIPAVLPQGVTDKLKDLSGKFPFCIPFDLVNCFKSFGSNEAAEAPKWDLTFSIPGTNKDYEFSVDLSMFDKYIPIFRSGVLILFLIGLMIGTRKLIGWQVKN